MKRKIRRVGSQVGSGVRVHLEGLESRRLMDGIQVGNQLFFVNSDPDHGSELWKSDLDGSNPTLVKDIRPGVWDSTPDELFAFNGTLFFTAMNGSPGLGRELYKSDGTESGTVLVKDIYPYGHSSNPSDFRAINGHLVFLASPSGIVRQLYATDGTTAGTIRIFSTAQLYVEPRNLRMEDDGLLHFDAINDQLNAYEEWQTDGTVDGTVVVGTIPSLYIHNGQLNIHGTHGDDQIQLSSAGGLTTVTINGDSEVFGESAFTSIRVDGLEGNDSIALNQNILKLATLVGGEGNDTLTGGVADGLDGGAGANVIQAVNPFKLVGGQLMIYGTSGGDSIQLRPKSGDATKIEAVMGGKVQDLTRAEVTSVFVDAGGGSDLIKMDTVSLASRVYSRAGNDTVVGSQGADRVYGGDGDDWIGGGDQNDTLYGEAGNDRIFGGAGRDYVDGGAGADVLRGEGDQDRIIAKAGEDDYKGNSGDLISLLIQLG